MRTVNAAAASGVWAVDDEAHPILVPNMILQPCLENANQHGIEPLEAGVGVTIAAHVPGTSEAGNVPGGAFACLSLFRDDSALPLAGVDDEAPARCLARSLLSEMDEVGFIGDAASGDCIEVSDKIVIVQTTEQTYRVRETLNKIEQRLPPSGSCGSTDQ